MILNVAQHIYNNNSKKYRQFPIIGGPVIGNSDQRQILAPKIIKNLEKY